MEATTPPEVPKEERQWAALAHLSAFLILLVPVIGGLLGPLLVWIFRKDDMPFVRTQGREAINFQISVLVALAVSGLLLFVLVGLVLLPLVLLMNFVLIVVAAIQASDGRDYRYPFNLRLLR